MALVILSKKHNINKYIKYSSLYSIYYYVNCSYVMDIFLNYLVKFISRSTEIINFR